METRQNSSFEPLKKFRFKYKLIALITTIIIVVHNVSTLELPELERWIIDY